MKIWRFRRSGSISLRSPERLQPEDIADDRTDQGQLDIVGAERTQALLDLVACLVQCVRGCDAIGLAEQAGRDAVGSLAERRTHDAAHDACAKRCKRAETLEQGIDQPRLAHAGLRDQADDLRPATLHARVPQPATAPAPRRRGR